jgi:hypothetical protein
MTRLIRPLALASLSAALGCYSWTTPPSLRPGMQVRVEAPTRLEIRDTAAIASAPPCHAMRVEGRLEQVRTDALTIRPRELVDQDDGTVCGEVRHALVPTGGLGTFVTVRELDRKRTTWIVVGGAAWLGLMLLISDQGASSNTVY